MPHFTTKGLLAVSIAAAGVYHSCWGSGSSNTGVGSPFPGALAFTIVTIGANDNDPGSSAEGEDAVGEERMQVLHATTKEKEGSPSCRPSRYDPSVLQDPCALDGDGFAVPEHFSLVFPTQYGSFTAECSRARAPVWADRVYRLAKHGYYNDNYLFRVLKGKYAQFGTNGHPDTSNVYNYTSPRLNQDCSILEPQPPFMPYCMANKQNSNAKAKANKKSKNRSHDCDGVEGLSNDFGTIAMSTSYKMDLEGYPNGVTWNATAELFINIGEHNQFLDSNLFVPICIISRHDMETVVLKFPSFGEVSELGGDGPSLGKLYEVGNDYIESNPDWKTSMALTGTVEVCP